MGMAWCVPLRCGHPIPGPGGYRDVGDSAGVYLGAGGGPLLFGLVAERSGTATAWVTSSVLAMVAAATLIVVRAGDR